MHGPPPPPFPVPYNGPPYGPAHLPPPPDGQGGPASDAAPRGRRLLAWSIDSGVLLVAALLLGAMTWGRLQSYVAEDLPHKAWSAGIELLLSGGSVQKAAGEFGAGVWGTFVAIVEQALLLLVLAELLLQFVGTAWLGRTVGKAAMDLRVAHCAVPGKPGKARAARRALVTTASGTGLYALAWVLLLEGLFFFAVLLWLLAIAAFLANSLPALVGRRRRTLADLVGGTVVMRAGGYQRAVAAARQGAVLAWDGTQAAGQVVGQAARDNAARLAQHDRVRQAVESEQARRLQELGRQSAGKLREAAASERAQQVQDAGKRLGGRFKDAYRERRAGRAVEQPAQPALPPPQPPYASPVQYDAPQPPYQQQPYQQQPYEQPPPGQSR
ncbi:RDD family protein [Actinomadura opuntiae]|uniref:RDD family protein n=1 Tax=Actinomadura sp. OS1-43 TaxID=604315 RepID=UPI00255AC1CF|nr:RDD family protein [Actinomadura sp. OS1-43]MDL4818341.1 RDD family protein [Actinomadura sp. OS1-43]